MTDQLPASPKETVIVRYGLGWQGNWWRCGTGAHLTTRVVSSRFGYELWDAHGIDLAFGGTNDLRPGCKWLIEERPSRLNDIRIG
jgi:hypothetical protein